MDEVYGIVDSIAHISDKRKEYLKQALGMRYEQILAPALRRALNEQNRAADIETDYWQTGEEGDKEDIER